jgi:hypothetical protein
MKPRTRERTRNNPKKINWLYPVSSEVKYIRMIREQVGRELKNIVNEEISLNLQAWIDEKKRFDSFNLKTDEIIHYDTWIDEINQLIRELNAKVVGIFGNPEDPPEDSEMWGFLLLIAAGVFTFNEKQWNKITREFLGFEFTTDTAWWGDVQAAWASENYTLIKSLSEEYIGKLNEVVFRGVRDGLSYREIIKELNNSYGKVFGPRKDGKMSKTELLVRDQIGKLNGLITKNRMQEAGAEYYTWQTAFDERVRGRPGGRYPRAIPSHWEMQGKICRWDNNSLYSNGQRDGKGKLIWLTRTGKMPFAIPGQEILCRCTALIYWEEILKEVDAGIEKEAA